MKKLKVLHLLQSSRYSGAENVALQIIDMFKNDNIEMVYCSRDGQISETLADRNIIFFPLVKCGISEVRQVVNQYQPDIIHAHDAYASVLAGIVARKKIIISHMHRNHEDLRKLCFKSLIYAWCTKRFSHIFWVSNSAYDNYFFKTYISSISSVLCNVLDRSSVIKRMNEDYKEYIYDIVYVGRLTYQKDPERLIKILKIIIEKCSDIKIAIVGTGDLLDYTRQLVIDSGLDNSIFFLGFLKNPLKVMKDAKVMIITSRFEGTPMSALEAMALGVPIVSTPTDGLIDLVENGITGFLSDDDKEIAEKLLAINLDKELRLKLSAASINKFNRINDLTIYKNEIAKQYLIEK